MFPPENYGNRMASAVSHLHFDETPFVLSRNSFAVNGERGGMIL
jgi:hypothetical protein